MKINKMFRNAKQRFNPVKLTEFATQTRNKSSQALSKSLDAVHKVEQKINQSPPGKFATKVKDTGKETANKLSNSKPFIFVHKAEQQVVSKVTQAVDYGLSKPYIKYPVAVASVVGVATAAIILPVAGVPLTYAVLIGTEAVVITILINHAIIDGHAQKQKQITLENKINSLMGELGRERQTQSANQAERQRLQNRIEPLERIILNLQALNEEQRTELLDLRNQFNELVQREIASQIEINRVKGILLEYGITIEECDAHTSVACSFSFFPSANPEAERSEFSVDSSPQLR